MLIRNSLIFLAVIFSFSVFSASFSGQIDYLQLDDHFQFENSVVTLPGHTKMYSSKHSLSFQASLLSYSLTVLSASKLDLDTDITLFDFSTDSLVCNIASDRGKYYLEYMFNPFFSKEGQIFRVDSYKIEYELEPSLMRGGSPFKSSLISPLASGQWVKIKLQKSGIYKISGADLKSYGFSSISSVRIFGDNGAMLPLGNGSDLQEYMPEVPLFVNDGGDGEFNDNDYVLFYGQSPHLITFSEAGYVHDYNSYSGYSHFLITVNNGLPKYIQTFDDSGLTAEASFDYFDDTQLYEVNDTNIVLSGREFFQSAGNRTYQFDFPNYVVGGNSSIRSRVVGSAPSNFNYSIYGNDVLFKTGTISGNSSEVANDSEQVFDFKLQSKSLNVRVSRAGNSKFWLDYLMVTVPCRIELREGQLLMKNSASLLYDAVEYFVPSPSVAVWDVTDFNQVAQIQYNGSKFNSPGRALRTFVLFDGSNYLKPEFVETVKNQNLAGSNTVDMIIIAHPNLQAQAQRLAQLHKSISDFDSYIVSQDQIFNEFSSGRPDVAAVRNYLRHMYMRDGKLRYLLFLGDGSYDNSKLSAESAQLITYQSKLSINSGSFVSDDFFGLLDTDEGEINTYLVGNIDIGIGRIPVNNPNRLKPIVDKIIHYATSTDTRGAWRNNMLFLADDLDNNLHMKQADELANRIESLRGETLSNKVFPDAFRKLAGSGGGRYPDANIRLLDVVKKGVVMFNYTGHGNPVQFGGERFLTAPDLKNWKNIDHLPLVITASCEVGRYDNPARLSLAELLLLQDDGGAIALLTTTRLVYASPNFELNKKIIDQFAGLNEWGSPKTMGDIIRCAKNDLGIDPFQNKRNFSLLGDPALRISLPMMRVVTDSINGDHITVFTDTVSALSEVRISGHIENVTGSVASSYNGIVYPTILDKYRIINTLDNNGEGAFTYKEYANILFKGRATIRNGYFAFSFLVPKDISYRFDTGKISYYADNGLEDASGHETRFYVGGTSDSSFFDEDGPELNIFMNDSSFVFGGTTSESPTLLVKIKDESGVNITGNAVGHDLTAVLDADLSNIVILNDFYQSNIDNYKEGSVAYPLSALAEGKHTVRVKVWDALNNSSEDFLEFYVSESADLALKHVLNYPNPFTTNTSFYFEHNQAGRFLNVQVQIFTISGKLVKTLYADQFADGFRVQGISWDGRDDYGDKIGRGVYFYRVKVRTDTGASAEVYQKLVVLK